MADVAVARGTPDLRETPFVRQLPPAARFILRGDDSVIAEAARAMGLVIGETPCRASQSGTCAALWLGPDEYLLLAPEAEARTFSLTLEQALHAAPHSLVDVSHRQAGLAISGPHAADILNSGCPLDLGPAAFPVEMCTRTVFAKAEIILWRTAPDEFRIEVWRSFADYVARFLDVAAREF
ncbi:MAG TPA: sarcosine oxidase subunit gamma family protein [Steroidobacteraceae bacterium]